MPIKIFSAEYTDTEGLKQLESKVNTFLEERGMHKIPMHQSFDNGKLVITVTY